MASKSAAGRRRMQKAAQKSAAVTTDAPKSKFTLPPTPPYVPRAPSPQPPLFYLPPQSHPHQISSPRHYPPASSSRSQWTVTHRSSSPSELSSSCVSPPTSRAGTSAAYYAPPLSVSSGMSSSSRVTPPYVYPSPPISPPSAPSRLPSSSSNSGSLDVPREAKEFVLPSPSRRGNTPKTTQPPPSSFLRFGRGKKKQKSKDSSQSETPSRFRALLSREKRQKKKNRESYFPPPVPPTPSSVADSEPTQRRFVEQQYDIGDEWFTEKDSWIKKHETRLHPYQSDAPYPVAFDFDNLDCDRFTNILFGRLNPNGSLSPSFYDYGQHPPLSVLDLGCGAGHWVKAAAKAWKPYGTMVTGFDLVDVTQGVLSYDGGANFNLVRGNFLKHKLPFADESFDLVRIADMALAITYDKWDFVLWEARRVLRSGGRLEIIDDEIIFPYALQSKSPTLPSKIPKINEPRAPSSIEVSSTRPGSRIRRDIQEGDDESLVDYTPILDAFPSPYERAPSVNSTKSSQSSRFYEESSEWERDASACQEMETIFESMLYNNLRIHPRPSEFLIDALKRVFGRRNSNLLKTMHLKLAPPEMAGPTANRIPDRPHRLGGVPYSSLAAAAAAVTTRANHHDDVPSDALGQSPGLLLWPDTLVRVTPDELVQHVCKHIETLIGCKSAIADFVELRDDGVRVVDEEFWDAWADYEAFVRPRFDGGKSSRPEAILESPTTSLNESMNEYQSMFSSRFEVGDPVLGSDYETDARTARSVSSQPSLDSFGKLRRSASSTSDVPAYTRAELVHVRTIRVYEATKT